MAERVAREQLESRKWGDQEADIARVVKVINRKETPDQKRLDFAGRRLGRLMRESGEHLRQISQNLVEVGLAYEEHRAWIGERMPARLVLIESACDRQRRAAKREVLAEQRLTHPDCPYVGVAWADLDEAVDAELRRRYPVEVDHA